MPENKLCNNQHLALIAISGLFKDSNSVPKEKLNLLLREQCKSGRLRTTPSNLLRDLEKKGYISCNKNNICHLTRLAKDYLDPYANKTVEQPVHPKKRMLSFWKEAEAKESADSYSPKATSPHVVEAPALSKDTRSTNERLVDIIKKLIEELENVRSNHARVIQAIYVNLRLLFEVSCSNDPEGSLFWAALLLKEFISSEYLREHTDIAKQLSDELHAYGWSTEKDFASEISFSREPDNKRSRVEEPPVAKPSPRPSIL